VKAGRHYVGYDIDETYAKLADKRVREFTVRHNAPMLFDMKGLEVKMVADGEGRKVVEGNEVNLD
jgi:hypothetical protein